jgi:hypothetical protein
MNSSSETIKLRGPCAMSARQNPPRQRPVRSLHAGSMAG